MNTNVYNTPKRCEFCDCSVRTYYYQKHCTTQRHIKNVLKYSSDSNKCIPTNCIRKIEFSKFYVEF